jgi:predicted TIM-barrel fold metal-dependent hydrolase
MLARSLGAACAATALVVLAMGCRSPAVPASAAAAPPPYTQVRDAQLARRPDDFRRISTHEHYRAGASIDVYLRVARELGIEKTIFVPTGLGPDNRGYQENMAELLEVQRRHPDRVVAFATIDEADPNAAAVLEAAVARGARGLKLIGGHPHFYDEHLDSPNMYRVYRVVQRHHLPILVHASLSKIPEQRAQLERVLDDFPDVTVIAAHYAEEAPHLEAADELFAAHPNLLMDLSMGGGLKRYESQIEADPGAFRDFILRHPDRLLWGTDVILTRDTTEAFLRRRITKDFAILEQPFYVDDDLAPGRVRPGLHLPANVLEKIYLDNPRRLLGL